MPAARVRDAALLGDFIRLRHALLRTGGNFLLHLLEPRRVHPVGRDHRLGGALARSAPGLAIAVAAVMGLAPLTSETSSRCSRTRT